MKIAVTGAAGRIGKKLSDELSKDNEVVRIDVQGVDKPVDVENLEEFTAAIEGCQGLIHLATYVRSTLYSTWPGVQRNMAGMYNAYEAARLVGVKQVIFASSNHAVGMFEILAMKGEHDPKKGSLFLTAETPMRADGLYAVGKCFGEVLGRYYSDEYGINVACVRIGSVRENDQVLQPDMSKELQHLKISDEDKIKRMKQTWLSKMDFVRLCRAIFASDVPYGVCYGISNNPTRYLDLEAGRTLYGFWPQDSP